MYFCDIVLEFSKSKGHNSSENYLTWRKFKLNGSTCVSSSHIYIRNFNSKCQFVMESENHGLFLSPRDIALPKIIRPDPNSNSACVFSRHIYILNFNSKISICNGDNERKLKINGIFLSLRGITLPKIIRPDPNSNSTCVFSWQTYIPNFNSKISICNGDNERKLKINGIFLSPRGITLPKIIRPNPKSNSTCVFSWQTYIPNFNSKCQFVIEIMNGNWKLMEFF